MESMPYEVREESDRWQKDGKVEKPEILKREMQNALCFCCVVRLNISRSHCCFHSIFCVAARERKSSRLFSCLRRRSRTSKIDLEYSSLSPSSLFLVLD